jgi:hypothetical protein
MRRGHDRSLREHHRAADRPRHTTLTGLPTEFDVATHDVRLCGTIVTVDPESGHATAIERLCVTEADLPALEVLQIDKA